MALKFIDLDVGLPHLWSKIKALIAKNGTPTVTATSSDGVTYTATLSGVTALTTGLTITIVPSVVSTSISAKLNLNNLGAKYIRQSTTNNTATGLTPKNAGWMAANKPITIQYDGTQWKTIAARSNASDMNGTVAIANGGTGATDAETARANLGITNYSLPTASSSTLGGVKVGTGLSISSGVLSVDSVSQAEAAYKIPYATCSTAVNTVAKVATISNSVSFSLEVGAVVFVKFSNAVFASNAGSPTLNVNSTGAKTIRWKGTAPYNSYVVPYFSKTGRIVMFVYDGTYWNCMTDGLVHESDSGGDG